MFSVQNYFILFAILIVLTFLYKRLEEKRIKEEDYENYHLIQEFLLNDSTHLGKIKKPILWIYIPREYNARSWKSFGSRSSYDLNQPYLYLTVKSVIQHCQDSFYICLIDDDSFPKLIPQWEVQMKKVSSPISCKLKHLAMAHLIYIYGGVCLPISFLCMRDLLPLYENGIDGDRMFICENIDRNVTSTHFKFYPDIHFFGAERKNQVVFDMMRFMEQNISTDFTAESHILGELDRWCENHVTKGEMNLICGRQIGVKNMESLPILVEDLLGQSYVDLDPNAYGIWVPAKDILNRRQYEWFARLSPKQVLSGNTVLCKYFALTNAGEHGVIEHYTEIPSWKKRWVSFWNVPSGAPVYGMRPLDLGDESVQRLNAPNN